MRATAASGKNSKSSSGRPRLLAPLVLLGLSCATTPPSLPLAPRGDAGTGTKSGAGSAASSDDEAELGGRQPLPPPPDPSLWADVVRPEPSSVSLVEPGGDVDDTHGAALVRLLEESFGMLRDKGDQVRVELPDSKHWKRVRYRAFDHLTGFRYGGKYHAVSVLLTVDTRAGRAADSLACIRQAETMARPRARALNVEFGTIGETEIEWRGKRVVIHSVEGTFPWAFKTYAFSAAWASYPAYDKACLIYGIGIKHEEHPELARLLRDRWILEAAPKVDARTPQKPVRRP